MSHGGHAGKTASTAAPGERVKRSRPAGRRAGRAVATAATAARGWAAATSAPRSCSC